MEDYYKTGFMAKCAASGLTVELAEGLYKRAQLAGVLKSVLGVGARASGKLGDKAVQYTAKGINKIPGMKGKGPAIPSTALVPHGVRGGSRSVLDGLASGNLLLNPALRQAAGLGTLGLGYQGYKALTDDGITTERPEFQPFQYQRPNYDESIEGMSGVTPFLT